MSKGRVFAIIIVVLVLALMIGLFVTGMTRGAAWVLDVEGISGKVDKYWGTSGKEVDVNLGSSGIDVNVGDGKVNVHVGMNEEDRAAFASFLEDLAEIGEDGGFLSMFNFGFGSGHFWGSEFKDGIVVTNGSVRIPTDKLRGIKASWIGGSMDIKTHDSQDILLEQTCKSGSIPEDRRLVYRIEDGKLTLREGEGRKVSHSPSTNLTIYLPETFSFVDDIELSGTSTDITADRYTLSCHEDIEISVVSGNVNLDGADAEGSIKINSTSGDMVLSNCRALEDVKTNTTSGKVKLSEVRANKIKMNTTSGDVRCDHISAKEFESDAVSGNVTLKDSEITEADCSSVSGDVTIESGAPMRELDCDTTSGNIRVTLPAEQGGFTAKYGTVSGTFRCDFETVSLGKHEVRHGDGTAKFSFNTVSGDMQIIKG